jgi:hypothetical protein
MSKSEGIGTWLGSCAKNAYAMMALAIEERWLLQAQRTLKSPKKEYSGGAGSFWDSLGMSKSGKVGTWLDSCANNAYMIAA